MELQKCKSLDEKLDAFVQRIPDEFLNVSRDEHRNICASIYNRLIAMQNYETSNLAPLRSSIILLKPSMPTLKYISEDYGLGLITSENVEVRVVEGNHITILDESSVATAINSETLEEIEVFHKARVMEDSTISAATIYTHHSRA